MNTDTTEKEKPLYGYICHYGSKRIEVYANSLYEATRKAREEFRAPKSKQHMVTVTLAEKDGQPVTHVADF